LTEVVALLISLGLHRLKAAPLVVASRRERYDKRSPLEGLRRSAPRSSTRRPRGASPFRVCSSAASRATHSPESRLYLLHRGAGVIRHILESSAAGSHISHCATQPCTYLLRRVLPMFLSVEQVDRKLRSGKRRNFSFAKWPRRPEAPRRRRKF